MNAALRRWRVVGIGTAVISVISMLATASAREPVSARGAVVPDRTILLLQQELQGLSDRPSDAVVYGGSRETELLRQIAAATRASAQAQIELLRQQNEIIRLLGDLAQRRAPAR